jgi:hypothetical protein
MVAVQDDADAQVDPPDRSETAFAAVLDRAASFGEAVHGAVASLHPPEASLTQMPASTVWRLHLTATASYEAAVQCLRLRYSSLGAYILLRGLLEAWAHLDFIADGSQGGSPALRAIRYELGVLQEWEDSAHDAPDVHPSSLIAQANRAAMLEQWAEHGGHGTPPLRTRKHVAATLTNIAARERFDWLRALYRTTSGTTHMLGVDFLLQDAGGTTLVVWATPALRSSWLAWTTVCFEQLSRVAVGLMGGTDVKEMQLTFNQGAHAIIDDLVVRARLGNAHQVTP